MDDITILFVEDDAIAQLTFLQYLKDLGCEKVVTVNNGYDAIEKVESNLIDLAFLDIRIRGDIDGIETARILREKNALLPIIFLTASTDKQTIQKALDCHPYSIIHKPYDLATLNDTIQGALNYKLHQEEVSQLDGQYMLDQILDTADLGICVTNDEGKFVKVNHTYCTIHGYSEQELIGRPFTLVFPEEIRKYAATLHHEYLIGNTEEGSGEWKIRNKSGNHKDVSITVGRLIGEDGCRFRIATVTDISQRKLDVHNLTQALQEKDTYAREIHHRVKNNMNIMSGLLYLQAEKVRDQAPVYNLFQESINRIKTLAIIHEQLYRHDNYTQIDLKEYVHSLVGNVKATYRDNAAGVRITQKVTNASLDVDKAIACGLIINEVLSNAFKYAFDRASTSAKCVNINAYTQDHYVYVTIADNGVGLPDEIDLQTSTTLGYQLINNLTQQLNGELKISRRNGTRVSLQFPQ